MTYVVPGVVPSRPASSRPTGPGDVGVEVPPTRPWASSTPCPFYPLPGAGPAPSCDVAPGFVDEHIWLSSRLLIQVRRFRTLTVITPSGMIGRYEWRRLGKAIRNVGPDRKCVLDLVHTVQMRDSILLTVLSASRQRRYRGVPFLLCNLPVLCGLSSAARQVIIRRPRPEGKS